MTTKLDERDDLIKMIDRLDGQDQQKLLIFLAGLEAGRKSGEADDKHEKTNSQT